MFSFNGGGPGGVNLTLISGAELLFPAPRDLLDLLDLLGLGLLPASRGPSGPLGASRGLSGPLGALSGSP